MGYRLAVSPSFKAPVKVPILLESGKKETRVFTAVFKRKDAEELAALGRRMKDGEVSQRDVVLDVFINWEGVENEDGTPMQFTEENRDRLLSIHPTTGCVFEAYMESIAGASLKN